MAAAVVPVAADVTVPPAPPPSRRRSRLALAVGDAVLCLCLAKTWLFVAGATAVDLGRFVSCGEGCSLLFSAAAAVVAVSDWFALETFAAIFLLFFIRAGDAASEEQVPVDRKLEATGREVMRGAMLSGMTIGLLFLLLIAGLGDLLTDNSLSLPEDPAMERVGYAFWDAWILAKNAMYCFIMVPIVALRLWRVTRPGWRCSAAAKIKNP